jgi:hypothetical protein
MAVLMIKCPLTGQDMSTGILTDSGSYQRIPDPLCGLECAWWHNDAWLKENGRQTTSLPTITLPRKGAARRAVHTRSC